VGEILPPVSDKGRTSMRQSITAVVERNGEWSGQFQAEPYETAWATEAIYFIRALEAENIPADAFARIQISPDGMHWVSEGSSISLPSTPDQVTFCRIEKFGGWLRVVGELPAGARLRLMLYLVLKE
jgi:hypothetical protein